MLIDDSLISAPCIISLLSFMSWRPVLSVAMHFWQWITFPEYWILPTVCTVTLLPDQYITESVAVSALLMTVKFYSDSNSILFEICLYNLKAWIWRRYYRRFICGILVLYNMKHAFKNKWGFPRVARTLKWKTRNHIKYF